MLLNIFAVVASIVFAYGCYLFYQDPRYAIQDPFTLILLAVSGSAAALSWLVKLLGWV